jgi:hypothetical protein
MFTICGVRLTNHKLSRVLSCRREEEKKIYMKYEAVLLTIFGLCAIIFGKKSGEFTARIFSENSRMFDYESLVIVYRIMSLVGGFVFFIVGVLGILGVINFRG